MKCTKIFRVIYPSGQRALLTVGGFLRVLQFPPTGNVDRVGRALEGWDKPLSWDIAYRREDGCETH
jgi:hypothetical protein